MARSTVIESGDKFITFIGKQPGNKLYTVDYFICEGNEYDSVLKIPIEKSKKATVVIKETNGVVNLTETQLILLQ